MQDQMPCQRIALKIQQCSDALAPTPSKGSSVNHMVSWPVYNRDFQPQSAVWVTASTTNASRAGLCPEGLDRLCFVLV